jgi:glycosyltransferase involved in cell wall biosynthesis
MVTPSRARHSLRVLHVHSGNLHGGVETFLATIAKSAAETHVMAMDFALCFEGRIARELRAAGVRVHPLGPARLRSPLSVLNARSVLARELRRMIYDVVVIHSTWSHVLFAPVVKESGSRIAFYMHDIASPSGWLDRLASLTAPDLVLCNSDFTARKNDWLFPGVSRRLLRYPVALEALGGKPSSRHETRASLHTADDAVVILQASRMQSWKGQHLLIAALAGLKADTRWTCWIAGGTQRPSEVRYEQELRSAVTQAGLLGRVHFLGQRDDVPTLMRAADIFCQPNATPEPYGIVFVEALAAGLPVVATSMGGALEIVDASCGVLVHPDAHSLSTALSNLIDDNIKRLALSRAGPSHAHDLADPVRRLRDLCSALMTLKPSAKLSGEETDARSRLAGVHHTVNDAKSGPSVAGAHRPESQPVRVLHVHSGNLFGGIETYLRNIARYRAYAPSLEMEYAVCFDGQIARDLRDLGAIVHVLGPVRIRSLPSLVRGRRALARALRTRRYDVVVCHSAWSHVIFAPVVRKSAARLLHHMHDIPNPVGWLERWAGLTPPALVLCYHNFTKVSGHWLFPHVPRCMVAPPSGVSATCQRIKRHAVRTEWRVERNSVVILHASRMQRWKGHSLLLEALALLRDNARWVCWIAGGPQRPTEVPYQKGLEELAGRLGVSERVQFLGQRDDVPALMQAADIYCQPNTSPEPFGQAFVEALTAGLPVVTTNMGGGREIIDASCGILVAPDAASVAAALKGLIDGDVRRGLLSMAGRTRAIEISDPQPRMCEFSKVLSELRHGQYDHGGITR